MPSPFESLESLHISAIDIADSMIDLYLQKQLIAPDLQTSTLLDKNLASYKNDLFWLSRALESCDAQTGYVDDYLIYKTIFKKLTHFSLRDHELLDIGNTLLPIAYFFQFELPVEASFLIKELELQKESINALINLGELKRHYDEQRGEMLYLPHSSSAKIYLETFCHYPGLGRTLIESICEKSNQDNWERGLTSLALKRDPVHVALDLLYAEERDPLNGVFYIDEEEEEIAGFITLLKECLNKNDYIELIKRAIRIENDIDALAGFMRAVVELNPSVAESLFEAVVIRLERENFERCEAFLDKFAVWSEAVEYNTPTLGKLIAKLVGPTLAKASVPDHVSKIGGQIKEIIHPDDREKRDNVAPFRDDVFNAVLASIVAIVDAEEDVSVIEQYIETVNSSLDFDLSDEDTIYYEMLNAIDHDRLIKIINNERDTQKILSLLDAIGDRNEDVFEKLFPHLSVVVKHEFEKANALVD